MTEEFDVVHDPILGRVRAEFKKSEQAIIGGTSSTSSTTVVSGSTGIPEYDTDPVAPNAEDAWVLHTTSGGSGGTAGTPLGLLLALTDAGGTVSHSYQFSYYTNEGTTIRVAMS